MKLSCPKSFRLFKVVSKHLLVWSVTFSLLFSSVAPALAQEVPPPVQIPQLSYPFDTTQHTPKITRSFGETVTDASISAQLQDAEPNGHNGTDFDLPEGTSITAIDTGDIIFAGEKENFGNTVIIQHAWGQSLYAHLSEIKVASGHIEKGKELALSGHTGDSTGPHLHVGLKPQFPDEGNGHFGFIDSAPYFENEIAMSSTTPRNDVLLEASASASLENILGANTAASGSGTFKDNRQDSNYLYNYKYNLGSTASVHFEHKKRTEPGFAILDENSNDKLRFFLKDNNEIASSSATPRNDKAKVDGNIIEYPVIVSGIPMTLRYTLSENQVKEEFIIKEKPSQQALNALDKNLSIQFNVETEGLQTQDLGNGAYKFLLDDEIASSSSTSRNDTNGYWQIETPNVIDAKEKSGTIAGLLKDNVYSLTLPTTYLENASYPVTIDPTVIVNTSTTTNATQSSTQRHIVKTSDGTLHNFSQIGTQTATCNGSSQSGLLWFNSTDSGATWTCQGQLSSETSNLMFADARVDSSDNIYVVYSMATTTGGTAKDVFYRKLTKGSGASWTVENAQTVLDGTATIGFHYATLELEGTTRIWLATRYYDGTNNQVTVYYSDGLTATPTWTVSQTTLDTAGSTAQHLPTMVRFGSKIGVIYNTSTNTPAWRFRSDSDGLTDWAKEVVIGVSGSGSPTFSAVGDASGNVYLVINSVNLLFSYWNGSTWSSQTTITSAVLNSFFSSISTDGAGNVWVFYGETTGLSSGLLGNRKLVYKKGIAPYTQANFDETSTPVVSYQRTFDQYWSFVGGIYTDDTTEAGNTTTADTQIVTSSGDIAYFGLSEVFDSLSWDLSTNGVGGTITWEYCSAIDGSSNCTTWSTLTFTQSSSTNFTADGNGAFTAPNDWVAGKVSTDSTAYYYIRARATGNYSTTPVGTQMAAIPAITGSSATATVVSNETNLIWTENGGSPTRIRSAVVTTTAGSAISATAEISPTVLGYSSQNAATQYSTQRHLVKTSDGTLHAFIQSATSATAQQLACGGSTNSNNNVGLLWIYSTDSGSSWTCGGQLSSETTNAMYADARVDSSDNIYVVYATNQTSFGTVKDVIYRKLTKGSGSTWTLEAAQTVLDGTGSVGYAYAVLELQGTDRIWIAARYYDGVNYQISAYYSDSLSAAPTWTVSKTTVDTATTASAHYPAFVRYGGNKLAIIFVEQGGALDRYYWVNRADSDDLTSWSSEAIAITQSTFGGSNFSAVGDSNGNIYAAAQAGNIVYFSHYNGSSWSTTATVSSAATNTAFVSLSIDNAATPNVYVLYGQTTGLNSGLSGNRNLVYKKGVSPYAAANFDSSATQVISQHGTFDKVWSYVSSAYTDETTDAASTTATDVTMPAAAGDIIYFGKTAKFDSLSFDLTTAGTVGQIAWEYYNGSTWMPIVDFVTSSGPNFTADGYHSFIPSSDWATTAVNGEGTSYYYIRARSITSYSVTPVGAQMAAIPNINWASLASSDQGIYAIWTENATNATKVRYSTIQSFNNTPDAPSSLGPSNLVSGGYITSNQPSPTFTLSDNDGSDTLKYQIQLDDSSDFGSPVVDYTSVLAAQGSRSFTVGQAAGSGSYSAGSSGQTLSDGSYYWRVRAIDNNGSTGSYSTANSGSVAFTVDTTGPGAVTNLTSSDHTISTWSADPTITMTWTAATDPGGSGVAGYYYVFDTNPTTVPTAADSATSSTTITSSSLPTSNSYYFHIRAYDTAGNLSSSTVASGPYFIDVTPPSTPGTPTTGTPTADTTPTWTWTASTDANSGLSTTPYTLQWSTDATFSTGVSTTTTANTTFTHPTALTLGTWYFRVNATDTLGNISSWATGSVVIDTTSPSGLSLISPANNAFTNNPRPVFTWQAATPANTNVSIANYTFHIDNGTSGDITISGIPVSSTTPVVTGQYMLTYSGFSDTDQNNNFISIALLDSASTPNNGALTEGQRTWQVTATDTAGNTTSASNTLYADYTNPVLSNVTVGNVATIDDYLLVTTNQPIISGTITDNLAYDSIQLSFTKENYFLGIIISQSLYQQLLQNLQNGSNATSLSFSFPTAQAIPYGKYQLAITGIDKAGNTSTPQNFAINILPYEKAQLLIAQKDKTTLKKLQETSETSLKNLEKKAKIRVQKQKAEFNSFLSNIQKGLTTSFSLFSSTFATQAKFISRLIARVANYAGQGIQTGVYAVSHTVQYGVNTADQGLTYVARGVINTGNTTIAMTHVLAGSIMTYATHALPETAKRTTIAFYTANKTFNDNFYVSEKTIQKRVVKDYQANGQAVLQSIQTLASIQLPKLTLPQIPVPALPKPKLAISWPTLPHIPVPSLPAIPSSSTLPPAPTLYPIKRLSLVVPKVPTLHLPSIPKIPTPNITFVIPALPVESVRKSLIASFTITIDNAEDIRKQSQTNVQGQIRTTGQNLTKEVTNSVIAFEVASQYLIRPYNESIGFADRTRLWLMTFNSIVLDPEPTKIANVTLEEIGKDYAIVSWETNHISWGKVNYGDSLSYGHEVFTKSRGNVHTVKLTGLKPGDRYFFEVMSQGKDYVYDAYYSFETKK